MHNYNSNSKNKYLCLIGDGKNHSYPSKDLHKLGPLQIRQDLSIFVGLVRRALYT